MPNDRNMSSFWSLIFRHLVLIWNLSFVFWYLFPFPTLSTCPYFSSSGVSIFCHCHFEFVWDLSFVIWCLIVICLLVLPPGKAPKLKHQITNKKQYPIPNDRNLFSFRTLTFRHWCLIGICHLSFDASSPSAFPLPPPDDSALKAECPDPEL